MQHSPRFLALVEETKARIKECTLAELQQKMQSNTPFSLIDVREESEFAAGRIPGAIHLGKGILERDVEAKFPDLQAPLVLYCGGGYRSALAADALQKMGYQQVISMEGGFRGWVEAGLPVERS